MAKSVAALVIGVALLFVLRAGANAGYADLWVEEPSPTNEDLNDVFAVTKWEAWAVGDNGTVLKRDASGSWHSVDVGLSDQSDWSFHGLFFRPGGSIGWIVGERNVNSSTDVSDIHTGIVLKTTNGGNDWTPYKPSPPNEEDCPPTPFYDVYFTSDYRGWISAGHGYVLTTSNGGGLWVWHAVKEEPTTTDSLANSFLGLWAAGASTVRNVSEKLQ